MKTFSEYITEQTKGRQRVEEPTLYGALNAQHPDAAKEAKSKGLIHAGFGVYNNRKEEPVGATTKHGRLDYKPDWNDGYGQFPDKLENHLSHLHRKLENHANDMKKLLTDRKFRPEISPEEKEHIADYSSGSFKLNKNLISGKKLADFHRDMDDHLQSAFDHNSNEIPHTLYTGLGAKITGEHLKSGKHYLMQGYTSASLSPVIAGHFADKAMLQIHVPRGARVMHVSHLSRYPNEKESLIDKNTKLRIISGPHYMKGMGRVEAEDGRGDPTYPQFHKKFYRAEIVNPSEHHKFANDTMEEDLK